MQTDSEKAWGAREHLLFHRKKGKKWSEGTNSVSGEILRHAKCKIT